MNNLNQKRKQAAMAILAATCASGVVAATPTPNIEIPKQIFLTLADVAMCTVIWDIYFDEELLQKDIKSILLELGLIAAISIFTAYITARAITTLTSKLTTSLGSFGWGIEGLIAGCATILLGMAWAFYCDDLYRHPSS